MLDAGGLERSSLRKRTVVVVVVVVETAQYFQHLRWWVFAQVKAGCWWP
jgi:hypothetical protein